MIFFEGNFIQFSECCDFVEWYFGWVFYLFWVLDFDMFLVWQCIDWVVMYFFGLLFDVYWCQLYLMLDVCGFFSVQLYYVDDFVSQLLLVQFEVLCVLWFFCFEIDIGVLVSFFLVFYLKVGDCGNCLVVIWQCLVVEGVSWLIGDYILYVMVGFYVDVWLVVVVYFCLVGFVVGELLFCCIEQISLMSYVFSEIGGVFSWFGSFYLDEGVMCWYDVVDWFILEFWVVFCLIV